MIFIWIIYINYSLYISNCFVHFVGRHTAAMILHLTNFAEIHLMTSRLNWLHLPPRRLRHLGRLLWRSLQKTHTMVMGIYGDAGQGLVFITKHKRVQKPIYSISIFKAALYDYISQICNCFQDCYCTVSPTVYL